MISFVNIISDFFLYLFVGVLFINGLILGVLIHTMDTKQFIRSVVPSQSSTILGFVVLTVLYSFISTGVLLIALVSVFSISILYSIPISVGIIVLNSIILYFVTITIANYRNLFENPEVKKSNYKKQLYLSEVIRMISISFMLLFFIVPVVFIY